MYERLYEANRGLIWTLARRYAGLCTAAVDVEDLVQQGFLGLVRASESFDPSRAAWSTWAVIHVKAAMRQALGRGKAPPCASLDAPIDGDDLTLADAIPDDSAPSPEAETEADDLRRCVRAAVDDLPEASRDAIRGAYFAGRTQAQLAEAMDLPPWRVQRLISEGRERLARDRRLEVFLDEYTRFAAHKGVGSFERDWTSTVEAAVLWRERMRERWARSGEEAPINCR